ncbi:MAG: hypothetical protein HRT71_15245 [Flavobacteriales bacterium]|nr:hypothetical protein [Flavobacteriales bacterium]
MNWGLVSLGFGMGMFKFSVAHWVAYHSLGAGSIETILEIFVSVTAGAWLSMSFFFFSSSLLMRKAAEKRARTLEAYLKSGEEIKRKKTFTLFNKSIVWIKRNIGIYGITFLAPLLLSIPVGSIVCAKFYGKQKQIFPLMMLFSVIYSFLMCLWMYGSL